MPILSGLIELYLSWKIYAIIYVPDISWERISMKPVLILCYGKQKLITRFVNTVNHYRDTRGNNIQRLSPICFYLEMFRSVLQLFASLWRVANHLELYEILLYCICNSAWLKRSRCIKKIIWTSETACWQTYTSNTRRWWHEISQWYGRHLLWTR